MCKKEYRKKFVISDTHFFHKSCLDWPRGNDEKVRDFYSIESMHDTIVDRWNSVVTDDDLVIHLGDVFATKKISDEKIKGIMRRLNGDKWLALGNHDHDYLDYFVKHRNGRTGFGRVCMDFTEHVVSEGVKYTAMLTHRPLASNELRDPLSTARHRAGSADINIHGDLNDRRMRDRRYVNVSVEQTNCMQFDLADVNIHGHLHDRRMSDRRYVNVSVEQTNYTPVDLHELIVSRVEEVRNGTLN